MLKNYWITAWRNLTKNKIFSFINIFGLTAGLTVCLMIFLFVMSEFSVDSFHKKGKNIYRVMRSYDPAKPPTPYVSGPYAPALLNDFPGEITAAVRVLPNNSALVVYKDRSFYEKRLHIADSDFFTLFSFPFLKGNPATALKDGNSAVLSETDAKKIFGKEEPIGKIIEINKNVKLMVTGIIKDVPVNSTLNFGMIMSLTNLANLPFMKDWAPNGDLTYVLLDEQASKVNIEKRLPAFMQKYMGAE